MLKWKSYISGDPVPRQWTIGKQGIQKEGVLVFSGNEPLVGNTIVSDQPWNHVHTSYYKWTQQVVLI